MIKIILVEDHFLVRDGIKMLLEAQDNIEIVAELANGEEVASLLREGVSCDIIITDIDMPEMDGYELGKRVREDHPAIKVIFLSMLDDWKHLRRAFNAGAKGYLVKDVSYEELLFAINHIYRGGQYLSDRLTQKLIALLNEQPKEHEKEEPLRNDIDISERELEVLHLIGEGYTNLEIADKLFLSKRTVEGHRQNLIDKTGTKNSASLVKYAVLNRLIS